MNWETCPLCGIISLVSLRRCSGSLEKLLGSTRTLLALRVNDCKSDGLAGRVTGKKHECARAIGDGSIASSRRHIYADVYARLRAITFITASVTAELLIQNFHSVGGSVRSRDALLCIVVRVALVCPLVFNTVVRWILRYFCRKGYWDLM